MPDEYSNKQVLKRLLVYLVQKKSHLLFLLISALCYCILDILLPYYVGQAIDLIPGAGQVKFSSLAGILFLMLVFTLLSSFFFRWMSYLSGKLAAEITAAIRKDAYHKMSRLPLSYYDQTSYGDITSRYINDCEALLEGLAQGVVQFFSAVITVFGCLFFMLYISRKVTLVVVLVTALTFVVARAVTRACNKYFGSQQGLVGELTGFSEEMISGIRTAKLYGCLEWSQQAFDEKNQELYRVGQRAQFASSLVNPTTRFVGHLAYIAVGVAGGTIGGLSVGRIASFIFYSTRFSKPFSEITAVMTQILTGIAAAKRVFGLIDLKPEPQEQGMAEMKIESGDVSFLDVSFSYQADRPLISHFTQTVRAGQRIAIVGPTGAGKTTLVNLIMRFYETDSGRIEIDGKNIKAVTRESLRSQIGMVLQETWLFEGTIAENIAFARPWASREEIKAAAAAAYCDRFINRLPCGYETRISDQMGTLSQGQRQLLTIARVILQDAPVLILDEATSSVDVLTEQRIQKAFQRLMEGRTSFIIAHRLSTIRDADIILVMRDGAVVEQGNHRELLKKGGFYQELYYKSLTP